MFPRLMICEGFEDAWLLNKLIEARGIQRFHIQVAGGNTKFAGAISKFKLEQPKIFNALQDIVVVADNDDDPTASFGNACAELVKAFGNNPKMTPAKPLEPSKTKPRCSILMVPWTGMEGTLETLCVDAAKHANVTMGGHTDHFLAVIGADKWPSPTRRGKAWLRSNLAARCESDPFIPLGKVFSEAKHAGLIPLGHGSFNQIADFLAKVGKT
jgi:Protein of unknown function (DUF3226)